MVALRRVTTTKIDSFEIGAETFQSGSPGTAGQGLLRCAPPDQIGPIEIGTWLHANGPVLHPPPESRAKVDWSLRRRSPKS